MSLTPEKIIENRDIVMTLVSMFPDGRREAVTTMLEGLVGDSYFTAPASTREAFHSAYEGGLVEHSLNVFKNLVRLTDALSPDRWEKHTLAFVSLFHDLGKAGDGLEEYYIRTDLRWKKERGEHFEINPKCLYMTTSERGLYLLQRHGVEVSHEEYMAIRLNDGQYVRENEPYRMKEPDLALFTHWADMWAVRQEKA